MRRIKTPRAEVWHGDSLDIYPRLAPGSFSLVISDGPYGIGKDRRWDPSKVSELPGLYRPHIEAWGRLCAPAASVYLWGTSASWAAVHPVMLEHGWTFRALVTWDKGLGFLAGKIDTEACRTWPDVTEVAGFYQRGPCEVAMWNTYGARHPARIVMDECRKRAGLTLQEIDVALGVSDMARHWFTWSQWVLPSEERWRQLDALIGLPPLADLRRMHATSWDAFARDRGARRAPFTLPMGITNVWEHPIVAGGERLRAADGKALHPCQKPLMFYRRMIRASTRVGDAVLEPFGGTCRAAVACQRLPKDEARRAVCIERDPVYVEAVRPALEFVAPAGGLFASGGG